MANNFTDFGGFDTGSYRARIVKFFAVWGLTVTSEFSIVKFPFCIRESCISIVLLHVKLKSTPTKNMLPRFSLSKSLLMYLSAVGSHLVRVVFFLS